MSITVIFLIVLSIALIAGCKFLVGLLVGGRDIRREDTLIERLFSGVVDVASSDRSTEKNIATVFSIGNSEPARKGRTMVFRATVGWRYGYLALLPVLIGVCVHFEMTDGAMIQTSASMYLMLTAFLIWGGAYIWMFRLEIDGEKLSCTSAMLTTRVFDLNDLQSAQSTRDGYALKFIGRRKISVPIFLDGHETLRSLIIKRLEKNRR